MRIEVVVACLTLCLVEAGSSHRRRHLTSPSRFPVPSTHGLQLVFSFADGGLPRELSGNVDEDYHKSSTRTEKGQGEGRGYDFVQSQPALQKAGNAAATDIFPIADRRSSKARADLLRHVFSQVANLVDSDAASSLTSAKSALTDRASALASGTSSLTSVKRGSRYKCDFTRVTIQMIIEYLRTRRICGYRVNRMRFGLGGK